MAKDKIPSAQATSTRSKKTSKPTSTPSSASVSGAALDLVLADPRSASPQTILSLQNTIGNQAVQRLIERTQAQPEVGVEGGEVGAGLQSQIDSARGGGHSLDRAAGTKIGDALGTDFSGVKVHTDSTSDTLNKSLNAKAFTLGNDVFFSQGAYNPGTHSGQQLLAHELTHVVQQGGAQSPAVQNKTVGQRQIQAKLEGAYAKLKGMGGEVSFKGKFNKSDYFKILDGVKTYEKEEQKEGRKRKSPQWFLTKLATLERRSLRWLENQAHVSESPGRAAALWDLLNKVRTERNLLGGQQNNLPENTETIELVDDSDSSSESPENKGEMMSASFGSLLDFLNEIWEYRTTILGNAQNRAKPYDEVYDILTKSKKPSGETVAPPQDLVDPGDFLGALVNIEEGRPQDVETVSGGGGSFGQGFSQVSQGVDLEGLNEEQTEFLKTMLKGDYNDGNMDVWGSMIDGLRGSSTSEEQKKAFNTAFDQARKIANTLTGFSFVKRKDDIDVTYRIYINVNPVYAGAVMDFISHEIIFRPGQYPGVLSTKVTGPRLLGSREDSILIYVGDERAPSKNVRERGQVISPASENIKYVVEVLKQYHSANPEYFSRHIGAMQEQVAPGIGLGAEPNKQKTEGSFNMVRAEAIFEALQVAQDQNEFTTLVAENFTTKGINFYRPHENL